MRKLFSAPIPSKWHRKRNFYTNLKWLEKKAHTVTFLKYIPRACLRHFSWTFPLGHFPDNLLQDISSV